MSEKFPGEPVMLSPSIPTAIGRDMPGERGMSLRLDRHRQAAREWAERR